MAGRRKAGGGHPDVRVWGGAYRVCGFRYWMGGGRLEGEREGCDMRWGVQGEKAGRMRHEVGCPKGKTG